MPHADWTYWSLTDAIKMLFYDWLVHFGWEEKRGEAKIFYEIWRF